MSDFSKRMITVMVTDMSPYDIDRPILEARNVLDEYIKEYGPDTKIVWNPDYWPQYSTSPCPRYELHITREETDSERDTRVAEAEKFKTQRDERDRLEFKRLQEKFEGEQ